jgi:hypothetical protein
VKSIYILRYNSSDKKMKRKTKIIIILVMGILIATVLIMGCVKKERWTWDEHGPGKDEWYEPGIPDDTPGFESVLVVLAAVITVAVNKIWRN